MTEDRLRELEWAATYCQTHSQNVRAGSRVNYRELGQQVAKLTPEAVLELIAAARGRIAEKELDAIIERFRNGTTLSADVRLFGSYKGQLFATTSERFYSGHTSNQEFRVL